MPVTIAITTGCPSGIGLELFAAALSAGCAAVDIRISDATLLFCGPRKLLEVGAQRAKVAFDLDGTAMVFGAEPESSSPSMVRVECLPDDALPAALQSGSLDETGIQPGAPAEQALAIQRESLLLAIAMADRGDVDGIVTLPIRKRALDPIEGGRFPGHTELLGARLGDGDGDALMVFAGGPFLLGLATVHLPIADVSAHITQDTVGHALTRLLSVTRAIADTDAPKVTVLGHNPHAGEGGRLGREEIESIAPAIAAVNATGAKVTGPVPADGFFAHYRAAVPDAVLAMHHDQGLGPYKILSGGAGVNLTWGLKCVRTSPDHGTADGLAGTGEGDPTSLAAALGLCIQVATRTAKLQSIRDSSA